MQENKKTDIENTEKKDIPRPTFLRSSVHPVSFSLVVSVARMLRCFKFLNGETSEMKARRDEIYEHETPRT